MSRNFPGRGALASRARLFPVAETTEAPHWARNETNTRLVLRQFRGADRDRTDDLRLAKPALSQLSYSPVSWVGGAPNPRLRLILREDDLPQSGPGQS